MEFGDLTVRGKLLTRCAADIRASRFSVGVETLDRDMWDFERVLPRLGPLGAKWARVQTGWCKCEREAGVYTFEWLDRIVDPLLEAGLQPWFNVGYGNRVYIPDAPHFTAVGWSPIFSAEARDGWARFTEALAAHFAGRVQWFEVWNEPDISAFWAPHESSATDYANLVKLTAPALRRGNPEAKVIGGAVARSLSQQGLAYFEEAFEQGLGEHIDAVSYHLYTVQPEPRYAVNLPALRGLVDRYRPGLPLWQGESGAPSVAVEGQALSNASWTEARQAKWNTRRSILDLAAGADLVTFFHASDFDFYIVKDRRVERTYHFGLCGGPESTPKPAYYAAQTLCTLFAGDARPCPAICVEGAPQAYGFETTYGPLIAYWNPLDVQLDSAPAECTLTCWLPAALAIAEPVLVEPISQEVYALPAGDKPGQWRVPLVDWPLLIADGASLPIA